MTERTSSEIKIYRRSGNRNITIATVPIASSSVRSFKLMEQDYIRLDFSLNQPKSFVVGDNINDPIFGKFVITKKQMPSFDANTATYSYSLEFEAEYMLWKNKMFCLTTNLVGETEHYRKECVWTLTNTLEVHVQEILNNLDALGITGYSMDLNACEKRNEVRCITYNGTNIIDAMKQIADAFETEWWVNGKIICFGKCELDNTPYVFELNNSVASMDIQDNRNTYANKIYVYGSTKNLPYSYRRDLVLNVLSEHEDSVGKYYKVDKAMTTDMVMLTDEFRLNMPNSIGTIPVVTGQTTIKGSSSLFGTPNGSYTVKNTSTISLYGIGKFYYDIIDPVYSGGESLFVSIKVEIESEDGTKRTLTTITPDVSRTVDYLGNKYFAVGPLATDYVYIRIDDPFNFDGKKCKVNVEVTTRFLWAKPTEEHSVYFGNNVYLPAKIDTSDSFSLACSVDGEEKYIKFSNAARGSALYSTVRCDSTLDVGDVISVDAFSPKVPSSFYTTKYDDPSALAVIGDTRLMLPEDDYSEGFIKRPGVTDSNAVEALVVFENVYPDGKLYASSVTAAEKKDYTEFEGETEKTDWQWFEYTVDPFVISTGERFKIKKEYLLPNQTLQIKFLAPQDVDVTDAGDGYKLAGMTFDAKLNTNGTVTIVRNSDYGTLLPNSILKPEEGDAFILIGWDPRSMSELGLIEDAEQRLLEKGEEYLEAMEEGQFAFTCTMNSDWMFSIGSNGGYSIPGAGTKVKIKHGALGSDKVSRVIGFEMFLDKPYDSPKYIVGETEAYSRLAKIEKELTSIK